MDGHDTSINNHNFTFEPEDLIDFIEAKKYIEYLEQNMNRMECYQDENNQTVFNLKQENEDINENPAQSHLKMRKTKKHIKRLITEVNKENIILHPINIANINRMVLRDNRNILNIEPNSSMIQNSFKKNEIKHNDELDLVDLTQAEYEINEKEELNLTMTGKEPNFNLNEFGLELTKGLFDSEELKTCKFLAPTENRKNLKSKPFEADAVDILKSNLISCFL